MVVFEHGNYGEEGMKLDFYMFGPCSLGGGGGGGCTGESYGDGVEECGAESCGGGGSKAGGGLLGGILIITERKSVSAVIRCRRQMQIESHVI
ncbi:hypothetical protein E3N88_26081 [Mikania micrantha]|uniref:Uncharacterized protein n=1 Tax=Mikania micrantha TaxID=192012 RepID=A0A5N6N7K1_9ASTR|nr:hypothetical protein E3N88_26081 [Mikania micrantha]